MATAADILNWARSQLGVTESPPGSNHVRYWDDIGRSDLQGQPWCGAFVSAGFKACGMPSINFVYCPAGRNQFAAAGRLFTTPQPGDVVFYEWEHDVLVDHTGVVEEVHPAYIVAIEGNAQSGTTGDQSDGGGVFRRQRTYDLCNGFGRPAYLPTTQEANSMIDGTAIAIEATPSGGGYYICSDTGAIYAYGDAHYEGGGNQYQHPKPFVDLSPVEGGYLLVEQDGHVFAFGAAKYLGAPVD